MAGWGHVPRTRTGGDLTLALLRIEHLRRLEEELGKSEAQAVLLRLLAPALTAAWRFFKPF